MLLSGFVVEMVEGGCRLEVEVCASGGLAGMTVEAVAELVVDRDAELATNADLETAISVDGDGIYKVCFISCSLEKVKEHTVFPFRSYVRLAMFMISTRHLSMRPGSWVAGQCANAD